MKRPPGLQLVLSILGLCGVFGPASCGSSPSKRPSTGTDAAAVDAKGTDASSAAQPVTTADLAAAGLPVFTDPSASSPIVAVTTTLAPTPLRLLKDQADAMSQEAAAGQGMRGSDLDHLLATADGLPPPSYFLAGYVSAATTPGAALARRVMGDQDWVHAPAVTFPSLVLTLFAADAARYANALSATGSSTFRSRALSSSSSSSSSTLCSDAQDFINSTINAFFDSLGHLQSPQIPKTGNGFVDSFLGGIQAGFDLATGVVNGLIDAGRFVVINGVKQATQPVLDEIAAVASTAALAAQIVTVLRPWTVIVKAAPATNQRAKDPGPGIPGTFTVAVMLPGPDEWPALAVNCAMVAGVTLPPLKPIGAPVVWSLTQALPLVTRSGDLTGVLDGNATASLGYTTVVESMTDARGDMFTGLVQSDVSITRKEISDAQKTIADLIFKQIPALLSPYLQPILAPTVTALLGLPAELLATHGSGELKVTYHQCMTGDCCPTGMATCGGPLCIDLQADPLNCGGCGHVCPSGQSCQGGACTPPPPPPPPTSCTGSCPDGQACSGGTCQTIIGSCFMMHPPVQPPTCSDEFATDTVAKVSCVGPHNQWSDLPCPTANRVGSCDLDIFILRYYQDTSAPRGGCTSDTSCSGPVAGQCAGAPIVDIPHTCVGGLCDQRSSPEEDAFECCFDCTANPNNPFPAVCSAWTPN
jgi:hypothetical protein